MGAQKKWYVYRNNEVLGPFEAQDIRNALRTGDIRAFDMVGMQDSAVRRPLVEVDEIFETKSVSYVEAQERGVPYQPAPLSPDMQKVSHGYLGGAINVAKKPAKPAALKKIAKPRRSPKKYFVHRNNNIVGPMTAKEIMQIYEKGGLPRDAKIQKNGRAQKLSLEMFVERYQEARGQVGGVDNFSMVPQRFDKPMGTMTKLTIGRSMDRSLIWIMAMSLVATVVVIGFLAFILTIDKDEPSRGKADPITRSPMAQTRTTVKPPPVSQPESRAPVRQVERQPERQQEVKREPVVRVAPMARVPVVMATRTPTKRVRVEAREIPEPRKPTRSAPVVRKEEPPVKRERVAAVKPMPTPEKAPVKREAPAPRPKPQPQQAQDNSARFGLIGDLSVRVDSTIKVGPLGYNMSDVEACSGICVVTFRGANGQSVNVKFFKQGFYAKLKSKNGVAIVEGTVRENGKILLLKGVQ